MYGLGTGGHAHLIAPPLTPVSLPAESCPPVLLLEPLHRQLSRWEVLVTVSPEDGPVSLLPVEVEAGSSKQELLDADLALQEWQMMQVGVVFVGGG